MFKSEIADSAGNSDKMLNLLVVFFDLCALVVYWDLISVRNHKRHLCPCMSESKIMGLKSNPQYKQSLRRNWFCILDTVKLDEINLSTVA